MKTFGYIVTIAAIIWVCAALFSFGSSDEVTVYRATLTGDKGDGLPDYLPLAATRYKISGNKIRSLIGSSFVNTYDNCEIFDINNWSCTYSDNSGSFGTRNGSYWQKPPHGKEYSRFSMILLQCRWDFTGDIFSGIIMCYMRPFNL